MQLSAPSFIISILLFMVLFFGMAFILNMLIKTTWIPVILYPIIILMAIDNIAITSYVTESAQSFSHLGQLVVSLAPSDITILSAGWVGAIVAGAVIRLLRVNNYRMF